MNKQLLFSASVCLAALCAIPAFAENAPGVVTQAVSFVNNVYITNDVCDATQPVCACDKPGEPDPKTPPALGCVQVDLGLGRARYSSLTKDIVLQLNEVAPSSRLYSPNGFRVVAGYSVNGIARDRTAGGAPVWVQIVTPSGLISSFGFADGESVGMPMGGLAGRASERLAMVDAQGWATAADPAFYDFHPGDGSRWRFGASRAAPDYLQIVEHQTPEGRVETRQDLGLEVFRDGDGVLRQVVTPAYLADFRVTGQDVFELKIYPNEPSCVPGTRAAGGWYDVAAGAVHEVFWTFSNPTPGTYGVLDVVCRRPGADDQGWRYTYMEALRDFTLISSQTGLRESRARVTSDDGKSMAMRRVKSGPDGKAYSQKELRYNLSGGAMALAASVRDPGGLNLTETYDYYTDGAAAGLQRQAVHEDGSWVRYEYDASRRKTAEIRPWLDAPTNAPAGQCAATRHAYAPFAPGDFLRFNDQRPRTEIGEVCGVEVSRTYHAYPTNALGQSQEIEELAAFPGAPYGHASSPRTVKTYYAATAAVPLAGRLAAITYPGGKTETYGYEYGAFNAAAFAFAADPDGGAWRETVTTSYGQNSGVQALRSARVWDERGREVLDESYVEDGAVFALIDWTRLSYDRNGKLTETAYSDGRVESATWGSNCCGKESERAADGTITVYGYNLLKQKVSETKKGMAADGSDDITTLYTYDLENRVLSTAVTNIASGLGYVASRHAYDAVGRVTNTVERLGNATVTAYDVLFATVQRPNGVTNLTERYSDGQNKRTLENGAVKRSYSYGVINPDGLRWTLLAQGPLPDVDSLASVADLQTAVRGLDFPWNFSVSDSLGRTVFEGKPGFGGTALVTSNAYDIAGNLLSTTQYAVSSVPANPAFLPQNLYSYADDGSLYLTALDLNTNGVINLEGPDRITGTAVGYEKDASNLWWRVARSWVYPEFDSALAVTTSIQRVRLTGLGVQQDEDGVLTSYSEALDVRGNATVSEVLVDRTARRVTQVTALPTSVQPQIQITDNGLLQQTVSSTSVTNTYAYDGLTRQVAATDGRGNTTVTSYTPLGLVAYSEDAATNRTSYACDALGRRTEVTDALGNITHTQYDDEGRVTKSWGATYPVEYGYDAQGRMVSMKTFRDENGVGDETRWLYHEPTGLLTNKVYADGKGTAYAYTPDGKLATRVWARGVATYYDYDSAGSLTNIVYSDSTTCVSFNYDRLGRQTGVNDASGTRVLTYTNDGRTLTDRTLSGASDFTLCEKLDSRGRTVGYALSNTVGGVSSVIAETMQTYETDGRLKRVEVGGLEGGFVYDYLPGTDLQESLAMPNGVTRTFGYEPNRDLVISIAHSNETASLVQRTFTYDAIGRLAGRTQTREGDVVRPDAFGYNLRSELTNAVMGANAFSYDFDPIGNRKEATEFGTNTAYIANSLNQYTQLDLLPAPSSFLPVFDADGNQTLLRTTTGIWHVWYNAENRPVLFSNDTAVVEMTYDFQGRRFDYTETVGGTVARHERYLYRGYLQIAALDILDGTHVLHTVAWDPSEPAATRPLVLLQGTNWWCYGFDQVKNVTELFNDSGVIAATYDYAPFGAVTASSGSAAAVNPITFSSEISDAVLGLAYYNYRPLDTLDGRWLTKDPIGDSGGINLYCFVNNNVVCKTDQWGTRTTTIPKCNVIIYLGHNYLVPQGNIKNELCSAGKVISCGGGRSCDPGTPDVEIPGTPPQKKGSAFITNNDAIEEANKSYEAGVLYARNSICKSTDCCCKTVQVKIICKFGFDIGSLLLFGPLGHNLCGKSETVNCGR